MRFCQRDVLRALVCAGLTSCFVGAVLAQDDVQEARPGVQVPDEHAKLGRVYRVVPSQKPQVTFRSKTRAEQFTGTTTRIIGYAVVANGTESSTVELAAGEFRLPVGFLKTKNESLNGHMMGKRWLNEEAYSEVAFTVSGVRDAKLIKEREGSKLYKAKLVGTMLIVGQQKELTVNAKIKLISESAKTKKIAPGDLMTIRADFYVVLSEFGIGIGDHAIEQGRIAKKIKIDVNLTLSAEPVETTG